MTAVAFICPECGNRFTEPAAAMACSRKDKEVRRV